MAAEIVQNGKKIKKGKKRGKKELTRGGKGGNIAYVAPQKQ